jgi:hypothetical protein
MALATIVAEILIGLGYDVDVEKLMQLAAAIAGLYIIVEGVKDSIKKGD